MKRCFIRTLFAVAAFLIASVAMADVFSYDGLEYVSLDETTCEVSVNKHCSGTASIPEQVINPYNGKTYTVTQIGKRAFNGAKNLTGMRIPKTVTVIYDNAFYGSGVKWITIEDSNEPIEFKQSGSSMTRVFDGVPVVNVYMGRDFILPGGLWEFNPPFSRNDNIQIVEIGDLVTSLPSSAFEDCPNLYQITIGSGLKSIGEDAFNETGTQNLYIDNLVQWCNIDFSNVYSNPLAYNKGFLHVGGADATYDIVIPDGVTKINSYAFAGAKLNSVTVPSGVTEIGDEVFAYCWGDFQTVNLPDGLKSIGFAAFHSSTLQTLDIPESVTSLGNNLFFCSTNLREARINANITTLGEYSFYECTSLQSVVLPPTLRVIQDWAFCSCSSLQSIVIPDGVQELGSSAFQSSGLTSVTIPNSITSMGSYCFNCKSLASVSIGSGLTTIPENCFSGSGLTSVTLPDNVTSLGEEAFAECASLAEANLGNGLRQISERCFKSSGLKSITIPSRITSIGVEAFADCASLATVDLGTGVREIPEKCFNNSGLTSITLPKNVTTVGEEAFSLCLSMRSVTVSGPKTFESRAFNAGSWADDDRYGMSVYIDDLADWCERSTFANEYASPFYTGGGDKPSSLYVNGVLVENLVIPDGVVRIGDYGFNNCGSIKTVVVPDGVVSIGTYAFYCPEMTKVTIGKTVNSIGISAFSSQKLAEFTSLNPVPPTTSGIGSHSDDFTVYVPVGSVDAYKNSNAWRYYNIKEIGSGGVDGIDADEVLVTVVDGMIVVDGTGEAVAVEVYDLSGRMLYTGKATEIPVSAGGVCIVKVAGKAFKVIL